MASTCIFCGEKPQTKTREHILPQWLLELTGCPNRRALFGPNFRKSVGEVWEFAFDQFTFPACDDCNNSFAGLEASSKIAIQKLLADQDCSAYDLDVLLDWLDKVRTGLWLGMSMLNKNPGDVRPNFSISARVGSKDRLYRFSDPPQDGRH